MDNIRCYFFIHGQWTRFQAKDIKLLLPVFFVDSKENKDFVESDEIDKMIQQMDELLKGIFAFSQSYRQIEVQFECHMEQMSISRRFSNPIKWSAL